MREKGERAENCGRSREALRLRGAFEEDAGAQTGTSLPRTSARNSSSFSRRSSRMRYVEKSLPDTNDVYVAPDIDVDLFFWNGWWWRLWEGRWYRSHYYDRGWGYYNNVPSFYFDVDPGWRGYYRDHNWYGHRWNYERIPYQQLQQNWRSWHNDRHWERQGTWGVQGYQPRPQQQRQELRQQRQQQYQQRPEVQQHQQQRQPQAQKSQGQQQPQGRVQQPQRQEQKPQAQQQQRQPQAQKPRVNNKPQQRVQQPQKQEQKPQAQQQQRQPQAQKPQGRRQEQQPQQRVQQPQRQEQKPQAQQQQRPQPQGKPEGRENIKSRIAKRL